MVNDKNFTVLGPLLEGMHFNINRRSLAAVN